MAIGPNQILTKTFKAGAVIAKNTIVKFDSTDDQVVVATSEADLPIGITLEAAAASGDRIEVMVAGIAEVKAAGVITRGDYVVATAGGEGVAGTAVTAKQQAIGIAMVGVADNDIFPCMITRAQFLTNTFTAEAAVTAKRLLKVGSVDDQLIHAVDTAAAIVGVAATSAAAAASVDVELTGVAAVTLGGTVTRGDPLTATAAGKAILANPATGVNSFIGGFALASGVLDGDINMLIAPGRIQG